MKRMRILLTGVTSFTGRHLLPLLREAGWEVFPLVRRPSGFQSEIVWDFLGDLPDRLPACDAVVHLAADVDFGQDLNCDLYRANTLATSKLVSYSQKENAYFVFASSVAVHGQAGHIHAASPIKALNHYALSKYLAEEVIKSFSRRYAILRIAGIYGLDGPLHLGLNKSINEAFYSHKVPTLKGTGSAKRNYICALDVARWVFHLLKTNGPKSTATEEIYYLADSNVMSIKEYLDTVIDELVPEGKLRIAEGQAGQDFVVEASVPPFSLMRFRDYLSSIKSRQYVAP